jgi:hypothetical protein
LALDKTVKNVINTRSVNSVFDGHVTIIYLRQVYISYKDQSYPQMSSAGCIDRGLKANQNPGHFREIKQKRLSVKYSL